MRILGFEIKKAETPPPAPPALVATPQAWGDGVNYGSYANVWTQSFDGEKNMGEAGPILRYVIDHDALRLRSWQAFLESEICQMVFVSYGAWVIGEGLKLQAEPQKKVLATEQVEIGEVEEFNQAAEARFKIYSGSKIPDYSSNQTLHDIADDAFKNAIVGGDVLIVLRMVRGQVNVQLIDGAHVSTPMNFRASITDFVNTATGNRVRHGIEIDAKGQPVAYHVHTTDQPLKWERIPARGPRSGALMAFMVYGLKYRLDNLRGLPLIAAVMETAKKMERYKEATLGSAEERQKIPYFIEHGVTSTGENPLGKALAKASGFGNNLDVPMDVQGKALANTVAATTNKMVFNMPNDSTIKSVESKNELHFRDFFTINIDLVCATIGIPPEVALSKYDSNYSSSRAAIKAWEHRLNVIRARFSRQFYQNIYALWLDTQVLSNKIAAPGYLQALDSKNEMAINAYRNARWVGANVPHIDPLKEVLAERAKLGALAGNLPLTTLEAATESINGGDAAANVEQYARELEEADDLGIPASLPAQPVDTEEEEEKDA